MTKWLLIAALIAPFNAYANEAPDVDDLGWMTGTWLGPLGGSIIEEVWTAPHNGSIAAVVRFTKDGSTGMFELITITEEDDTLVLRLQQFSPTMKPLKAVPETMQLESSTDSSVTFEGHAEGAGLARLTYKREDDETFSIAVTLTEGNNFRSELKLQD